MAMVQTFLDSKSNLPDFAIQAQGLVKMYHGKRGTKLALDHIDLAVPRGSFFGLLGPNGAGKSTFINILAGLVNKTQGRVAIWDRDIDRDPRGAKAAIGVVPQELNLDPFFTPRELLDVQAGLYGVPQAQRRTMDILDAVGLADKADAYARTLSGGMRRRLLVAKAMVHSPPVLILDEPTAGVDIELRQSLWAYVKQLKELGSTIVLTTHYLEEAQELCDTIAIINKGTLVACDSTDNLLRRLDCKALVLTVDRLPDRLPDPLPAPLVALSADVRADGKLVIHYRPSETPVSRILDAVSQSGLVLNDLSTQETDLEDIFLQLTSSRG